MKKITLSTLTILALSATSAMAVDIDHPHDRIKEQKSQGQEGIKNNIKLMEAQLADLKAKLTTVKTEKSIMDNFHFKADLRLRYESIERDDSTNTYHNRYRLRLGAVADITEKLHFEVGMRSGYANPTSGNQSFSHTNDSTPENLNDYFMDTLKFNIAGLSYKSDNSTYKVGRQPYMMYRPIKSQLVWDNDISLNGANYQYKDDTKIITLGANQPTLEEKAISKATSTTKDVNLYIAQYVQKMKFDSAKLNLGTGIYYYDGFKGNTRLFGSAKGNTVDASNLYTNDYQIVEAFAELQFKDVLGKPLKIAVGVVNNFGADTKNFGYDLAFQLGKAKHVGDWQVKYSYTDLQEDATLGAYSDSDNFGGGTAASGHAIRAKYKFGKNTYLAGNFFFNEYYTSKSKISGTEPGYDRVQLDAIFKF